MPPPPPLLILFFLYNFSPPLSTAEPASTGAHHLCTSPPHISSCPPFPSPPAASSFPFAAAPGCGHPAFHVTCSSPHSSITINNLQFYLLSLHFNLSNSNAIRISPINSSSVQINLTHSPFRFSSFSLRSLSNVGCRFNSGDVLFVDCDSGKIREILSNGVEITWNRSDKYFRSCTSCVDKHSGVCGFNDSATTKPFLCFPAIGKLSDSVNGRRILVLTTALFALACVFLLFISLWAASSLRRKRTATARFGGSGDSLAAILRRRPPAYTYEQLRVATCEFDPRRKIGDGGFGSVYLAHLEDGRAAAVKCLHRHHSPAATASFLNEIVILSSLSHPNLVRLHGYCCAASAGGILLVYDYVPNGTLADHLHGSQPPLTWSVRVDVALQIALALEYLHFVVKPPIVHRDVTSANIFLDREMRVKLGDFGLSRLLSPPQPCSGGGPTEYARCTGPQGTPGYLDPEYYRSFKLTEKSDVYSFGVVVLELVTSMKAIDVGRDRREMSLAEMVVGKIQIGELHRVVDPMVKKNVGNLKTVEAVAELAFRCLAGDKDDRPDSRELVVELRRIKSQLNE